MFYFQNIFINEYSEDEVSKAIYKTMDKNDFSLDFQTSFLTSREEIKFFGKEDKTTLQLTRVRSLLSRYFPKIIIRFEKKNLSYYQIRFSIASTVIMIFLLTCLLYSLMNYIVTQQINPNFILFIFFNLLYFVLSYLEIYKTKGAIQSILKSSVKTMTNLQP